MRFIRDFQLSQYYNDRAVHNYTMWMFRRHFGGTRFKISAERYRTCYDENFNVIYVESFDQRHLALSLTSCYTRRRTSRRSRERRGTDCLYTRARDFALVRNSAREMNEQHYEPVLIRSPYILLSMLSEIPTRQSRHSRRYEFEVKAIK